MHSSATNTELVPNGDAPPSDRDLKDYAADKVDPVPGSNGQEQFSPDEYQRTDRYRLVRPYAATANHHRPGP